MQWFALVEPQEDIVLMRAKFGKSEEADPTLACNYLTSKQPIWISGPDVIASKILTGKPMKILKAFKVVPCGVQPGLKRVKLRGEIEVDPRRDDLSMKLIELRNSVKRENPALASGLKVAANSAAFGLFCQLNVTELRSHSPLRVFSGEEEYPTPETEVMEQPAEFYCPLIASLVTGGSHLLCAMLEREVQDRGGHIAAMDTDSAMIVSTRTGGLVPCAGGPHRFREYHPGSGHAAIRALSFDEVDRIRQKFESLNPWRETLNTPFLKLEDENFGPGGEREQLYAYCIAAKLYCLYNLNENGLTVRKPSGHGLGFLQAPYTVAQWERRTGRKWKENLAPWIFEAWHFILSRQLQLPYNPPRWFKQPALMTVPITRPRVLERLGCFKDELRPFTMVSVPFPKKEPGVLWKGYFIMPHTEKLDDLHGRPMVNVVSGATFYVYDDSIATSPKTAGWLSLKTMEDAINHVMSRCEVKFCTPNGSTCTSKTAGVLVRRHIVAGEFHYIGKEASRRWAGGVDLSMLAAAGEVDAMDITSREYERVIDATYLERIRTQAKQFSTKLLSRRAAVAECAIRAFKNGSNRIRPRSLRKLTKAIHDLNNKTPCQLSTLWQNGSPVSAL